MGKEFDVAKWALGVAFGAGVAWASTHTSSNKIEELDKHVASHDVELVGMRKDIEYIKDGVGRLLRRER